MKRGCEITKEHIHSHIDEQQALPRKVKEHLLQCEDCQRYKQEMENWMTIENNYFEHVTESPLNYNLTDQIMTKIKEESYEAPQSNRWRFGKWAKLGSIIAAALLLITLLPSMLSNQLPFLSNSVEDSESLENGEVGMTMIPSEETDDIESDFHASSALTEKQYEYFGIYDDSIDSYVIGMTDTEAKYHIPITIPAMLNEVEGYDYLQQISFNGHSDELNDWLFTLGLSLPNEHALLQRYEIDEGNSHVDLYFEKGSLQQELQGSANMSTVPYSIYTYALNFSDTVSTYTIYDGDEPFIEQGKYGMPIEADSLTQPRSLFPVISNGYVFLAEKFEDLNPESHETYEQLLESFLATHPLDSNESDKKIDLSILALSGVTVEGEDVIVQLEGSLEEVYEQNELQEDSLRHLIVHGIVANIRYNLDLFESDTHTEDITSIIVNVEGIELYNGRLDAVHYNYLPQLDQFNNVITEVTSMKWTKLEVI